MPAPTLAVLTAAGQAAVLQAGLAGNAPVQISQVALGTAQRAMTGTEVALTSQFAIQAIQTSTVDAVNNQIELATLFDGSALGLTENYNISEVGFIDTQGVLIFYWSTATGSLGALTPMNDFALAFALGLGAAPAGSITIVDQGAPGDLVIEGRMTTAEGNIAALQAFEAAATPQITANAAAIAAETLAREGGDTANANAIAAINAAAVSLARIYFMGRG